MWRCVGWRLEKPGNAAAQMASILPHLTLQAMKFQGSFQTELLACEPHHLIHIFLKSSLNQIFKIHLIFSVISSTVNSFVSQFTVIWGFPGGSDSEESARQEYWRKKKKEKKKEYWNGLPFPSPREIPDPGIEAGSPTL